MTTETDLYREILLEHARRPKRMGELSDANGRGQCHNPLCGDKVSVAIIVQEGVVKNIRILPSGCSISLASASLMTEVLEGMSLTEVETVVKLVDETFVPTIDAKIKEWPVVLKALSPLKRIRENAMKIPCVLISWIAVKDAIKDYKMKE